MRPYLSRTVLYVIVFINTFLFLQTGYSEIDITSREVDRSMGRLVRGISDNIRRIEINIDEQSDIAPASYDGDEERLEKLLKAMHLDKPPKGFKPNVPGGLKVVVKTTWAKLPIKAYFVIYTHTGFSKEVVDDFRDKMEMYIRAVWERLEEKDKKVLEESTKLKFKFVQFGKVTLKLKVPKGTSLTLSVENGTERRGGEPSLEDLTKKAVEGKTEKTIQFPYPKNGRIFCRLDNTGDYWKNLSINYITSDGKDTLAQANFEAPRPLSVEEGTFVLNEEDTIQHCDFSLNLDLEATLEITRQNYTENELEEILKKEREQMTDRKVDQTMSGWGQGTGSGTSME